MEQYINASRLETTDSSCDEARRNHKDTIVLCKCFVFGLSEDGYKELDLALTGLYTDIETRDDDDE